MTIHLPGDLESRVRAAVHDGHFASLDDAMAEAARLVLRELSQKPRQPTIEDASETGMGFIGALRDDAEWLDQAVEHAMKIREERPWRLNDGE